MKRKLLKWDMAKVEKIYKTGETEIGFEMIENCMEFFDVQDEVDLTHLEKKFVKENQAK